MKPLLFADVRAVQVIVYVASCIKSRPVTAEEHAIAQLHLCRQTDAEIVAGMGMQVDKNTEMTEW